MSGWTTFSITDKSMNSDFHSGDVPKRQIDRKEVCGVIPELDPLRRILILIGSNVKIYKISRCSLLKKQKLLRLIRAVCGACKSGLTPKIDLKKSTEKSGRSMDGSGNYLKLQVRHLDKSTKCVVFCKFV